MKKSRAIWLLSLFLLAFVTLVSSIPAEAQNKSVVVPRRDYDVSIQANGNVIINETWEVRFTGGPFTNAFRGVTLKNVDSIGDMSVSEGGRAYQQSSSETAGTFTLYQQSDQQFVKWYFPPTSNQTRTFNVRYTLRGALRIYSGGDQFWWNIIETDHGYTIQNSTITVHLPAAFSTDQLQAAVTTGRGTATIRDGQTVIFIAGNLNDGDGLEIRVQFPHGVVQASPPAWQAQADAEAASAAERDTYKSVFNLGFLFISVILLLLGPLALYLLWFSKGRDAPAHVVAQTSTPPDDLPPGVVGTLLDEQADMKDIVASIVDLARRGTLKMTEKDTPGFLGIGTNRDYTFELVGNTSDLRSYEQTLIQHVFQGGRTRDLSDLKEKFYTAIPSLKSQMYDEVTKLGFFDSNPNSTRIKYAVLGVVALVIFSCIGFLVFTAGSLFSDLAFCPGAALGLTAIGLIVISPFMPRRTLKGATEKAKWVAFKRYLENIEKYTKLEEAKELFDKYLSYTIAFGLERTWTQKFAAIGTPAPTWYEMYPPLAYGGRRVPPSTSGLWDAWPRHGHRKWGRSGRTDALPR